MQVSQVRLLRRILIALIAVVSLAVLVNYLQIWRRRRDIIKPATQILSSELLRSAENLEYVSNKNGVTEFRLRAKKLLTTRQGKELLQGIDANDFNPDGSVRNHISSETAEYDKERKQVFFSGDVRLVLGKDIELRMESLHYDHSNQTGYSDDRLQLASPQAEGTARGVRYDNAGRRLELLSDLDFVLRRPVKKPDGSTQVEAYHLEAHRGLYSEAEHLIRLQGAARLTSAAGVLAGDRIDAVFSDDKKRLTGLSCQGNAVYESREAAEIRTLQGERIEFGIGRSSRALESIRVLNRASFLTKSPAGEQKLAASEIQVELDPAQGTPRLIRSQSAVRFELLREGQSTVVEGEWLQATFGTPGNMLEGMHVRDDARMKMGSGASEAEELRAEDIRISFRQLEGRVTPRELQADRAVRWRSPGRTASEPGRSLTASTLTLRYSEAGEFLASGTASGGVTLAALPGSRPEVSQLRRLDCSRIDFDFYPEDNRIQSLTGSGNVQVFYRAAPETAGKDQVEEYRTTSSGIRAGFRRTDGSIETISQSGNFVYQDGKRTARSGSCDFAAAGEMLVLRDNPSIADANSTTSGDLIEYDRKQKTLAVRRNVRSILNARTDRQQGLLTAPVNSSVPSIVTSEEMFYWTELSKVRYSGSVHLLSADSQLQAKILDIVNSGESVEALGEVRHLILRLGSADMLTAGQEGSGSAAKKAKKSNEVDQVLIRSAALQYSRAANRIHYAGGVYLDSRNAKLWADSMDAFLDAAGKKVERAKAQGNLRITQPGREVKGEDAEYFLSMGKFVVTGNPAQLNDQAEGKSFAARLTFFTADDRILLEKR